MTFKERAKRWGLAVVLALDCLLAALVFGAEMQTVSEVAGLAQEKGETWGRVTCYLLEVLEDDHCRMVLIRTREWHEKGALVDAPK